jgi:hypothetical protein
VLPALLARFCGGVGVGPGPGSMPWGLGIWGFGRGGAGPGCWLRWVAVGLGHAGGRRVVPGGGRFHGPAGGSPGPGLVFFLGRREASAHAGSLFGSPEI